MHWLIITENQEKASRIREVLRNTLKQQSHIEATTISSKGLPWTVEVEITPSELNYRIKEKESYLGILKKIEEVALEADRVLLAFEPTTTGEANAWEFEKRLGREKCARLRTLQLDSKTICESIINLESIENLGLPKSNQQIAQAHWVQTIIDLTWTNKVNDWLSKHKNVSTKITRLMGIVIKSIADPQRLSKRLRSSKHWELELELKPISTRSLQELKGETTSKSKVIVPTLAQISKGSGPKAREFWKLKLEQSRQQSLEGWEKPQPEPGKPWRYHQHEDAKVQKQYIKKFPYFVVEAASTLTKVSPIQCPPTNNSIHQACLEEGLGKFEDIERLLTTLFNHGWITNPKSNVPSLHTETIKKLYDHSKKQGITLSPEARVFHTEDCGKIGLQAICPTSWELTPQKFDTLLNSKKDIQLMPNEQAIASTLYKKIYTWCVESQLPEIKTKLEKHFLSGPLFLSRAQAQEKGGKSFFIKKEEPFHAHMSVLLLCSGQIPVTHGEVMECTHITIQEVKSELPKEYTSQALAQYLCTIGAGKKDTISNIIKYLKDKAIVHEGTSLKLTKNGETLLNTLEESFGQYLDINYLITLNSNLKEIQNGTKTGQEFLNNWWISLRGFLNSHTEEDKLIS